MSTNPPMPPIPPAAGGAPAEPKIETFTQHDTERDQFHCSYGPIQPGRAVWDPEREVQVRLDMHSQRVIGFSIPEFSKWYEKHGDSEGGFEMDLPDFWPEPVGEEPAGS